MTSPHHLPITMPMENVLCVLAHQDDEFAMAPRIGHEVRAGNNVRCVYLTDGAAYGADSEDRNAESLRALGELGVPKESVVFLGSAHGIKDGELIHHLERGLRILEEQAGDFPIDQLYCLAWEGGHADHDASHLIALAFAKKRALLERTWEFFFYNGYRVPRKFFRVLRPLADATGRRRRRVRRLSLREGMRCALLCRFYKTQRKTWLGLLPEASLRLILLRKELMQAVSPEALRERPHAGPLLMETRFQVKYESFFQLAKDFYRVHFDS